MNGKHIVIARMANAAMNNGEEAILASMLRGLRQSEQVDITVLTDYPEKVRREHNVKVVHAGLKNCFEVAKAIRNADILMWAGGHMLQDQSSALDVPFHLLRVFYAKMHKVRVVLYAVEIGPLDTKIGRFFARQGLKNTDLILVRDEKSKNLLGKIGIRGRNIHVTADPAFSVEPDSEVPGRIRRKYGIPEEKPLVAIAPRKAFYKVSGFLPATVRLKLNLMPRSYRTDYPMLKKRIAEMGDHLIEKFGAQVVLLPMDIAGNPRDDKVCDAVFDLMKHKEGALVLKDELAASEVAGLIQGMSLMITQRLHALILSSSMRVPMIGIATTGKYDKCRKFLQDIGQKDQCVDAKAMVGGMTTDDLLAMVDRVWKSRETIREELGPTVAELKERAAMSAKLVRSLLMNHTRTRN